MQSLNTLIVYGSPPHLYDLANSLGHGITSFLILSFPSIHLIPLLLQECRKFFRFYSHLRLSPEISIGLRSGDCDAGHIIDDIPDADANPDCTSPYGLAPHLPWTIWTR